MEISTYPVGIKGQKFVLGVTHDITDRKNSEDNLKNQKVFMESVVENIPNMIFVKDAKQFKFEEMNKAGELLLGLKRKDILGKNLLEKFSKSQADFFLSKDREVIKSGKLLDIPEEFIDTPKGTRILHTKKIPIFDEKSKPLYLLGISEDITEKKKAEEKLKQSEEKYKQLTQTIAKPMFTINKKGIFLFINKEAAMQLRSTPEKMIGKTMWQFFPKKIAYRQMILICKVISSGKSIKLEERLLISGKLRWYETTMWPVKDNQGKIIAAQAIAIDITKFKKENEDLKRRLKKKCS
jgi:PAS domain S-box-containing protein